MTTGSRGVGRWSWPAFSRYRSERERRSQALRKRHASTLISVHASNCASSSDHLSARAKSNSGDSMPFHGARQIEDDYRQTSLHRVSRSLAASRRTARSRYAVSFTRDSIRFARAWNRARLIAIGFQLREPADIDDQFPPGAVRPSRPVCPHTADRCQRVRSAGLPRCGPQSPAALEPGFEPTGCARLTEGSGTSARSTAEWGERRRRNDREGAPRALGSHPWIRISGIPPRAEDRTRAGRLPPATPPDNTAGYMLLRPRGVRPRLGRTWPSSLHTARFSRGPASPAPPRRTRSPTGLGRRGRGAKGGRGPRPRTPPGEPPNQVIR